MESFQNLAYKEQHGNSHDKHPQECKESKHNIMTKVLELNKVRKHLHKVFVHAHVNKYERGTDARKHRADNNYPTA